MKKVAFLTLCILPFLLLTCKGTKGVTSSQPKPVKGVQFVDETKLFDVLDKAEAEDRLVFVDIYTDWCLPCKLMDEEVFSNKEISSFLNKNFINFKVDAEKGGGPNIASLYGVDQYPTLLFMDGKGRVLERKSGAAFHAELKEMADRAMSKANDGRSIGSK